MHLGLGRSPPTGALIAEGERNSSRRPDKSITNPSPVIHLCNVLLQVTPPAPGRALPVRHHRFHLNTDDVARDPTKPAPLLLQFLTPLPTPFVDILLTISSSPFVIRKGPSILLSRPIHRPKRFSFFSSQPNCLVAFAVFASPDE